MVRPNTHLQQRKLSDCQTCHVHNCRNRNACPFAGPRRVDLPSLRLSLPAALLSLSLLRLLVRGRRSRRRRVATPGAGLISSPGVTAVLLVTVLLTVMLTVLTQARRSANRRRGLEGRPVALPDLIVRVGVLERPPELHELQERRVRPTSH